MKRYPHTPHIKRIENSDAPRRFVWLHGWGHDHRAFNMMADYFKDSADQLLIDFPGFGQSPAPDEAWDTEQYAQFLSELINDSYGSDSRPLYLIGHSFGCRVSIRYAANSPTESLSGMILLASAGLQRKRSIKFRLYAALLKYTFRGIKLWDRLFGTPLKEKWAKRFGSADYRASQGVMRDILVKTVNEDLSEVARNVNCPVLLLTGKEDDHTPPEFARRYEALMKQGESEILPNFDHYTILSHGRHSVQNKIEAFINKNG